MADHYADIHMSLRKLLDGVKYGDSTELYNRGYEALNSMNSELARLRAALAAAPQPVKAEQDEREHLRFGATVLRVILQDALERGGEAALVPECRKWLEAERARLSAVAEPKPEAGAIIRAAEGVVLEPGEYRIVTVDDTDPRLKPGDLASPENLRAVQRIADRYNGSWAWLFLDGGPSTWVTAVRRVDPATDADSQS